MSKKDYIAIARAINQTKRDYVGEDRKSNALDPEALLADLTWAIADVLAADSPRFDRERFVRACETGDMGKARV